MLTTHRYGGTEWLDIVDPTPADLAEAEERYALGDRTFDEANRRALRPTLARFVDHAYVVAFSGRMAEIDMYLGPTWLVTVRRLDANGCEWDPSVAVARFERRCGSEPSSGLLLLSIIDELIDGYFDATDALEERIQTLEDAIFSEQWSADRGMQHDLFALRRELLELRRVVMPLREVIGQMVRREIPWVTGEALMMCHDTYDKVLRVVDVVDEQRELLGNAVDAHLALASNQMNQVMKSLTAWGSIVFGATLIAGIYGMNFDEMPELHWAWGYPFALASMVVLSAVLYRVFKRKRWL